MRKLYDCELPDCNNKSVIRSTIKEGEFKGMKACPSCKLRKDSKPKYTVKRKVNVGAEDRQVFFKSAIKQVMKHPFCENCGCKLTNIFFVNNVAHILSKRTYKSVENDPDIFVTLCSGKDVNGSCCHEKFDGALSDRESMPVFKVALKQYTLIRDKVLENGKEKEQYEKYIH